MANAYSLDLRERAIALIDKGAGVSKVSRLLEIGRSSLYLWLKQRRTTQSLKPKEDWRKGHHPKVTDLGKFYAFIKENEGLTSIELARKWGDISPKTIRKWMERIGVTRKKRHTAMSKGVRRNGRLSRKP